MTRRRVSISFLFLSVLGVGFTFAQNPGPRWYRYQTPEDAGWSSEKLRAVCRVSNANSVMLVQHGKVVFTYGQYWRRMKCHSLRKSFLGALYGIAVSQGIIDTLETIGQLDIPNSPPLTKTERQARVIDLLMCRSGVYLPSGQETGDMASSRPVRGSHSPGSTWYYNNWDFNVLGTIYRKVAERDIFEAFRDDIAYPVHMEDFRFMDGVYDFTPVDSLHPGYMFKMSARDAARFGQLYLQEGLWDGSEVLPDSWVARSTSPLSATTTKGTSYGLLWWVDEDFHGVQMAYAAGFGGQRICIVPALDVVVVVNSDTYTDNTVLDVDYLLPDLVFASRTGESVSDPVFVPLEDPPAPAPAGTDSLTQRRWVGNNILDSTPVAVSHNDEGLVLDGYHFRYRFRLLPLTDTTCHVEDIDLLLVAAPNTHGEGARLTVHKSLATYDLYRLMKNRGIEAASQELSAFAGMLRQKEELEFLCNQLADEGVPTRVLRELNATCFPYSYKVQRDLKDELLRTDGLAGAYRVFQRLSDSLLSLGIRETKTEWIAMILRAFVTPGDVSDAQARVYSGDYDYRHIVSDDGCLYYRTNGRKRKLYRIVGERFAIENTYNMIIEFGRDRTGMVDKITGHYYRDSHDVTYRTP